MLATATTAPGTDATGTQAEQLRPVRLLVPTVRRGDYYLTPEDTLRASDLGITRNTTDATLASLIDPAIAVLQDQGINDNPFWWMIRLRDALRHPRDIAEARAWGYHVPSIHRIHQDWTGAIQHVLTTHHIIAAVTEIERTTTVARYAIEPPAEDQPTGSGSGFALVRNPSHPAAGILPITRLRAELAAACQNALLRIHEPTPTRPAIIVEIPEIENSEEFDADPRKRLGWWWVYDLTRTETRQQREDRYLADHRLIDMRGFARIANRAYITIKDRKFESDNVRKVLYNEDGYRDELAATIAAENPMVTAEEAAEDLLAKAREDILKAMPPRDNRAGQSDQWYVYNAVTASRKLGFDDEWYQYAKIRQTGRPRGARTRNRRAKAKK